MISLLGPTASGKTALALELAERLGLPVINVDSRQLYREMDVGTAKPTAEQQARVTHHLLDLRDPNQPITLQEFQAEATPCIERELAERGIALLVGGSGLYLKALTSGLKPPAVGPQPELRQQFSAMGQAICHPLLAAADPIAAAKISPADVVRTQRALEVLYASGQPMTGQASVEPPPWRILELGLNPANLRQRINQRTEQLYQDGLVEETHTLGQPLRSRLTAAANDRVRRSFTNQRWIDHTAVGDRHHMPAHAAIRQTSTHLVSAPTHSPMARRTGSVNGSDDADRTTPRLTRADVVFFVLSAPVPFSL